MFYSQDFIEEVRSRNDIVDDSIARLLGHKDTRTIPHYRRLRNEALAEDTKAVRDEMNELLAQYRREKENAETR